MLLGGDATGESPLIAPWIAVFVQEVVARL